MINNPDSIAYLSPNRLDEVEDLIDFVKIVGRQMPINWIFEATKAYMKKNYKGNIAKILVPTNAIADRIYLSK